MTKNAIWAIVGLMAAALLGIIALQAYWIKNAIDIKSEQFNQDVSTALKLVAQELREREIAALDHMDELVGDRITLDAKSRLTKKSIDFSDFGKKKEDLSGVTKDYRKLLGRRLRQPRSLAERISPATLKEIVRKQLNNRNIQANYDFKVFEIFKGEKPREIIANGIYTAQPEDTYQMTVLAEEVALSEKAEYAVPLFDNAGKLTISFPQKSSIIWGAVLIPLMAAILFTAIVISCFAYTIQVIFTQKKLSEMKTDFVNNMTHEFKTPIATISLAVDSITSPMILSKQDKVKRFASIIKQENKRMLAQVEKVLQMALLDKKDFKLNLDFVDLHEVIEQAVTNSHLQAEKKGGFVTSDLRATTSRIEGDLTHISNIIHNLLDNANKYSREIPEIIVSTRDVPSGIEVVVKDNGIGLSKEARKNIFDKFYRVHTGNVHDVKGFGLGLAYVKTMMTAHKGQIDVKSELGKGSSFILTFPYQIREKVAA
ncbi:MAG: HAMP domain-containing sensor histidine kinase [Bacteroidota bacterium]